MKFIKEFILKILLGKLDFHVFFNFFNAKNSNTKLNFIQSLSFFKSTEKVGLNNGIILVEAVNNYEFLIKTAAAAKAFSNL